MNLYETERRVLRMLAAMGGSPLSLDAYDRDVGKRLEKTEFPISERELANIVRSLEEKGLVASILERLDGVLVALTAEGRALMEAEEVVFEKEQVEKTQRLFKAWFCDARM